MAARNNDVGRFPVTDMRGRNDQPAFAGKRFLEKGFTFNDTNAFS